MLKGNVSHLYIHYYTRMNENKEALNLRIWKRTTTKWKELFQEDFLVETHVHLSLISLGSKWTSQKRY